MDPAAAALIPKLMARCAADLEAMRSALAAGDLEIIHGLGHRMEGACGSFGMEDLAEVGRELQRAAAAGNPTAVATALERLAARLEAEGSARGTPAPRPVALRVLLLEDDPLQQELAATWLRGAGHEVHAVGLGRDAMRLLEQERVDIAILDWMVPDLTGEQLLRWIRERQKRLPVMFATSRDEEGEIAFILRLGADDYVVKPLRRLEFLARVQALGRRAGLVEPREDEVLEVGPYRLDPRARTLSLAGRAVKVTPRMLDVARLLLGKHGELVSRAQLIDEVWGHRNGADTRSVDTHVSRLRQALELDGRHGWRLTAVYQHGYRLEAAEAPRTSTPS